MREVDGGADLRALLDEIEAHPGTRARREWDALIFVHSIFGWNQRELMEMIEAIDSNANDLAILMAGNVRHHEERKGLFTELIRRLHNYLASVVTFVDHTRNLMRSYEGSHTHSEYEQRVAAVTAHGLARFVTKLRSYLLHYRLPQVGVQVSFDQGVESFMCFLNRDEPSDGLTGRRQHASSSRRRTS